MPTYIEINGLDESGSVGEPILFVRIGMSLLNEIQIFLRNIEFFNTLLPNKYRIKQGYEPKSLIRYVKSFIEDPCFDTTIFRMFPETQLKLLTEFSVRTAGDLYHSRESIIKLFDSTGNIVKDYKTVAPSVSQAINILKRFRNPRILIDSFVKSYGMMLIAMKLGTLTRSSRIEGFTNSFLSVQIAGGYPFAFWWKDFVDKNALFKKGSFVITGVSNGDEHYPSMSAAGAIATSLLLNSDKLHLFPVQPLEMEDSIDLDSFFKGHSKAIEIPTFQKRIIFLGTMNENVRMCTPYLMHLRDRRETYEASSVRIPIEWFFKMHSRGKPENTIVIHSSSLTSKDKDNLKICKKCNYAIHHVSDFKKDFEDFLGRLCSEIDYAPTPKRVSLSASLKKIEEECLNGLK
ncbi:MAG: hypothetical protein QW386_05435 [Candidatus Bathyarchaeia archaeon]